MPHVLALDQGTTSSRAIVFRDDGTIAGVAQREFEQIFPRPGWVEHDPHEIWASQYDVAREAISTAGLGVGDIAAIGITNQRETTVVWDRATGEPVHNAIVWQDRRTADRCGELVRDGHAETIRAKTGLVIDPYFSGTKIAWILDRVEGARARGERGELAFGTIDSWLVWNLTGGASHVTDVSNASRTMLFDIHARAWDEELCGLIGVPMSMLPEVRPSSGGFGESCVESLAGLPIAGVAGDQQAATFGQVCVRPGMAKNTYGTGCFLLLNAGTSAPTSANNLLTTVAWEHGGEMVYALEGSVFIGGAVVQWLRDGLGLIRDSSEVEALAASVPDNGGVFMVPALVGLGAPHWDPGARGAIVGLTRGSTTGHLARAALEGIAYQVADLVKAMEADTGGPIGELRVDGGASANDTLLQFQSDILRVPLVRPAVLETTALGAAYLAGLSVGVWGSVDDIARNWVEDRRFEPAMPEREAGELRARWAEAVERSKGWA